MSNSEEWTSVVSKRTEKKSKYEERKAREEEELYQYNVRLHKIKDERKILELAYENVKKCKPFELGGLCFRCKMLWNQYGEVYNLDNDPSGCVHTLSPENRKLYEDWENLSDTAYVPLASHKNLYGWNFTKI